MKANRELLSKIFAEHSSMKVPFFLWSTLCSNPDACSEAIWCNYSHDGAWVIPMQVSLVKEAPRDYLEFLMHGKECMEHSDDYSEDNTIYDTDNVLSFVEWYIEVMHPYLVNLHSRLQDCKTKEEYLDVVEDWCVENCYESYIHKSDVDDIIQWSKAPMERMADVEVTLHSPKKKAIVTVLADDIESAMSSLWHNDTVLDDAYEVHDDMANGRCTLTIADKNGTHDYSMDCAFVTYAEYAYSKGRDTQGYKVTDYIKLIK